MFVLLNFIKTIEIITNIELTIKNSIRLKDLAKKIKFLIITAKFFINVRKSKLIKKNLPELTQYSSNKCSIKNQPKKRFVIPS